MGVPEEEEEEEEKEQEQEEYRLCTEVLCT